MSLTGPRQKRLSQPHSLLFCTVSQPQVPPLDPADCVWVTKHIPPSPYLLSPCIIVLHIIFLTHPPQHSGGVWSFQEEMLMKIESATGQGVFAGMKSQERAAWFATELQLAASKLPPAPEFQQR